MKSSANSKSRLFFIEFLIVLFFFLIISTVCLKLFVHAHTLTKQSDERAQAQTQVASAAEILTASGGDFSALAEYFPDAELFDGGIIIFYEKAFYDKTFCDDTFFACTKEAADYYMVVSRDSSDPGMIRLSFQNVPETSNSHSESSSNNPGDLFTMISNDSPEDFPGADSYNDNTDTVLYSLSIFCYSPMTRKEALS